MGILVDQCEACGDIACFDVAGARACCRGCRAETTRAPEVRVVEEADEPLEALLARSNPSLWSRVQTLQKLGAWAAREQQAGGRLKPDGASHRLAVLRLAEVADAPGSGVLGDRLEMWPQLAAYEQRDLLDRIERHVQDVLRARRETAWLNSVARTFPGRWSPLRVLLPMAALFSLITVATLVVGDADVGLASLVALVLGPMLVLSAVTAALYPARVRGWLHGVFIGEAHDRGIEVRSIMRMLEVVGRTPGVKVEAAVRHLARARHLLVEALHEQPPLPQSLPVYVDEDVWTRAA